MKVLYIVTIFSVIPQTILCHNWQNLTCGVIHKKVVNLILGGRAADAQEHPWHSALFHKFDLDWEYQCGGTLVNDKFVVTARHCTLEYGFGRQISVDQLLVMFGLQEWNHENDHSQRHTVFAIHTVNDTQWADFRNDIALIQLNTTVQFTDYVLPACMMSRDINIGEIGNVVGFGITNTSNEISKILRKVSLPIIHPLVCLRRHRDFGNFLDENQFCAGYTDGRAVCNGDSGGGFMVLRNDTFQLAGIVSYTAHRGPNDFRCKKDGYGVFINVFKYIPWIEQVFKAPQSLSKLRIESRMSKVEYAERGSTVNLKCNTEIHPNSFLWSRYRGIFNTDQYITDPILTLTNVQAADAGTYICTSQFNEQLVDELTILVVNDAIPFFPQSPKSYMGFNGIDNSYTKFSVEISFKPEQLNGLILYNGQRRPNGDYIAISLRNGFPQFKFDFNGQLVDLQPDKPIHTGQWHTIKVHRARNNGFLLVDNQAPVVFPDELKFLGLILDDNLYIGGVPNFTNIPASAVEAKEGFVGCISQLMINGREVQLYPEAITNEGTTTCESCAKDSCKNSGVCLSIQSKAGHSCVCQDGYTGKDCRIEGPTCMPRTCGIGRCEETENGTECYCPIHKTGPRCENTERYTGDALAFRDESYAAYDKFQTKRSAEFRFKPDKLTDCVLLYAAERKNTFGDFIVIILKDGHVELRYSVAGKFPFVILKSTVPIRENQWHNVSAGRSRGGLAYLQIDEEQVLIEPKIVRATAIALKSNVYVGGYDKRFPLPPGIEVTRGFEGCISDLAISGNTLNMIDDIKDSANLYNCENRNSSSILKENDQEIKLVHDEERF